MDGFICQIGKEVNSLKNTLIGLLQVILLEYLGQIVDEFVLFLNVELFLDVVGLFDIVADL